MTIEARPVNQRRLFVVACLILFVAAVCFAMRGALQASISSDLFGGSAETIGSAVGVSFLGFAISAFVISPFLDKVGIKQTIIAAAICFIVSTPIIAAARYVAPELAYQTIWFGMLLTGIGAGLTEGAINPLIAAVYPNEKTHKMNVLHAWFPAGIIAGGLISAGMGAIDVPWFVTIFVFAVPAVAVLFLIRGQAFPKTESYNMGVSFNDMILEIVRNPSFLIWFGIMFLTASTELVPGQWVDLALTEVVGMRGILLLVFVYGLAFVMRHFAGPIVHRISSVGLLFVSSILACVGLLLMSQAQSPAMAITAAIVWGVGVCFMWPTMLGVAAERYARGGAWTIGLITAAGAMAIYFVLPKLGAIYDKALADGASKAQAAEQSFQTIALFPGILIVVFATIILVERFTRLRVAADPAPN
jgi:MFS family permease